MCQEGEIRLTGGNTHTEGTIEICYNSLWGMIAASGWNDIDSAVVCKQLGYSTQGI